MIDFSVLEALDLHGLECVKGSRDRVNKYIHCIHPEHDDTEGKLSIHQDGHYHCWSEGCPINEYPRKDFLAEQLGMELAEPEASEGITFSELLEGKGDGFEEFKSCGFDIPFQQDYRGISADTYVRHGAFMNDCLDKTASPGQKIPELLERLWFPIFRNGILIGVQGRLLYISKDTLLHKYHNFMPKKYRYPENPIVLNGVLYFVEGIMDYLNLYDKGVKNVCCLFGTTTIIDLEELNITTAIMLFDSDDAGMKADNKLTEKCMEEGILVKHINLPFGKDPGDLTQEEVDNLEIKKWWK